MYIKTRNELDITFGSLKFFQNISDKNKRLLHRVHGYSCIFQRMTLAKFYIRLKHRQTYIKIQNLLRVLYFRKYFTKS